MWVNNNDAVTWEKLVDALSQIDEKAVADRIDQDYIRPLEELKNAETKLVSEHPPPLHTQEQLR